jgi:hypothetical protein
MKLPTFVIVNIVLLLETCGSSQQLLYDRNMHIIAVKCSAHCEVQVSSNYIGFDIMLVPYCEGHHDCLPVP